MVNIGQKRKHQTKFLCYSKTNFNLKIMLDCLPSKTAICVNNYFFKQCLVKSPWIDVVIEIILKQFLLDIHFIIEVLVDPADMQTHTVFMVFSFQVLNYSLRAFTLTSILQLNLDGETHMKNKTLIFNSFCKINNFRSLNKILISVSIRTIKTLGTRSIIILKKFWFFWLNHQNTFPKDIVRPFSVPFCFCKSPVW